MSNRYRISFEIDCDYNDPNHWSWRFIHDELDDDDDQIVNGPTVEFLGPTSDFVPTSDCQYYCSVCKSAAGYPHCRRGKENCHH